MPPQALFLLLLLLPCAWGSAIDAIMGAGAVIMGDRGSDARL